MKKIRTKSGNTVFDLRSIIKKKSKCWYVVANRTTAFIFKSDSGKAFKLIQQFLNPEGRLLESALSSDRPGRSFSSSADGTLRHAFDQKHNHYEKIAQDFAMQISQFLEEARHHERVTEIVLVADPHFLGLLRASLSLPARKIVINEVHREYRLGSVQEIGKRILNTIQ